MTDISELAELRFEDLAEADLCDLVSYSVNVANNEEDAPLEDKIPGVTSRSRSPSISSLFLGHKRVYSHITLINGERICLKDEEADEDDIYSFGERLDRYLPNSIRQKQRLKSDDWCSQDDASFLKDTSHTLEEYEDMDLNYVLQAGVVEKVAPASTSLLPSQPLCFNGDSFISKHQPTSPVHLTTANAATTAPAHPPQTTWQGERKLLHYSQSHPGKVTSTVKSLIRPRATILASQLPQPVIAATKPSVHKKLSERAVLHQHTTKPQLQSSQLPLVSAAGHNGGDQSILLYTGEMISDSNNNTNVVENDNNNNISRLSSHTPDSANDQRQVFPSNFNNNSLLRSALTGKSSAGLTPNSVNNVQLLTSESSLTLKENLTSITLGSLDGGEVKKAILSGTLKGGAVRNEKQVDDIILLSLEGREAIARLKDGASQLFPNMRVTSSEEEEPAFDLDQLEAGEQAGTTVLSAASRMSNRTTLFGEQEKPNSAANSVISLEVDSAGNLVLHKSVSTNSSASLACVNNGEPARQVISFQGSDLNASTNQANSSAAAALLMKSRKYNRRPRDEPKKESRILHYCHICNKGFKDKYSVNVHVRTHTGEKPFACQLCGKRFRQKAHLAKHHQTHSVKGAGNSPPIQHPQSMAVAGGSGGGAALLTSTAPPSGPAANERSTSGLPGTNQLSAPNFLHVDVIKKEEPGGDIDYDFPEEEDPFDDDDDMVGKANQFIDPLSSLD